jgi:hypothetical protein
MVRHLRQWRPVGRPVGRFLSRAVPVLVVAAVVASRGRILALGEPAESRLPVNAWRDDITMAVNDPVNKHVILVRYTGHQSPHEEWVYNGADIDAQDVIWAHDLGSVENARLLEYYKDRKAWLFQPDIDPTGIQPYR